MGDGMDLTRQRIFGNCNQSDVRVSHSFYNWNKKDSGIVVKGTCLDLTCFFVLSIYSTCILHVMTLFLMKSEKLQSF